MYQNYIKELVELKKILGATLCITKDSTKEISAYGLKNELTNEKAKEDTLYDTASLTKVLTVMPIICRLIDDKTIKFETKLKSILPEFKYDDVTIYDILVHRSGLGPSVDMKDKKQDKETLINEMLKLEKSYKTGTDIVYSDIGYILLGLGLEKVFNKPLDKISKEMIFDPLKMNNTMFNPKNKEKCAPTEYIDQTKTSVYTGVVHDWKARLMDGVAGHAGVFTDASDIGNYIQMVLNKGNFEGKQFISEELIDLWFKNLVHETKANRNRSLCWITGFNKFIINGIDENTISFHGFSGPSISIDRTNNIGIGILSNSVHPIRENKDKLNFYRPLITEEVYKTKILK